MLRQGQRGWSEDREGVEEDAGGWVEVRAGGMQLREEEANTEATEKKRTKT